MRDKGVVGWEGPLKNKPDGPRAAVDVAVYGFVCVGGWIYGGRRTARCL